MNATRTALIRSLCYVDTIDYPPTLTEWIAWLDTKTEGSFQKEEVIAETKSLIENKVVITRDGRIVFPGRESLIPLHAERCTFMPRKLRIARRVTAWLARIQGVRFVALCNTTSLSHARDLADLDFFIVTHANTVWQTRGWAALPFKLANRRPRTDQEIADAVCLSFFLDDTALDLQALALKGEDPYLRYWFLSLLPLYDDGIGQALWDRNATLRARHPFASPWIVNPDLATSVPLLRIPTKPLLEPLARRAQERVLPTAIQHPDAEETGVVCTEHVLKFHTQDARAAIRTQYEASCYRYDVEP